MSLKCKINNIKLLMTRITSLNTMFNACVFAFQRPKFYFKFLKRDQKRNEYKRNFLYKFKINTHRFYSKSSVLEY